MTIQKVDQISAQFNVVQQLAANLQRVYGEKQVLLLHGGVPESLIETWGRASLMLMEDLGNILNAMDAVAPEDDWMQPVFERAHAMFPDTNIAQLDGNHG